jgi:hypothetical protein
MYTNNTIFLEFSGFSIDFFCLKSYHARMHKVILFFKPSDKISASWWLRATVSYQTIWVVFFVSKIE